MLYVITKSVWGGAQRYVFDLATNLPHERWETVVAAGGDGPLIQKLRQKNIRVIQIQALERDVRLFSDLAALWELFSILRHERPDVIHLNSSKIGAVGAIAAWFYNNLKSLSAEGGSASGGKAKIIFTAHGWAWSEERPWWQTRLIIWSTRLASLFQDAIIVLSRHDLATAVRNNISEKKLAVIQSAIPPTTEFLNALDAHKAIAQKLDMKPTRPLIGVIAELTKNKGIRHFIQACVILKQRGIPFSSVVIGEGGERPLLQRIIEENNLSQQIRLLGFLDNASQYMRAFDTLALTSVKEGLPYVLLEAQAAGIPTVASNIGGIPDIISHGENGLLVPAKDSEALADAMQTIAENQKLVHEFSKSALTRASVSSFETMLEKTTALYHN